MRAASRASTLPAYRSNARDFPLTDVHGEVVREVVA